MGRIDTAAGCCFSCCGGEAQQGVGGVQNQSCDLQLAASPWERIAFSGLALNSTARLKRRTEAHAQQACCSPQ